MKARDDSGTPKAETTNARIGWEIRVLLLLVTFAVMYVGSARYYLSSHLISSNAGGFTSTYVSLTDTRVNRALIFIYAPLIRYSFPAGAPIKWFSKDGEPL